MILDEFHFSPFGLVIKLDFINVEHENNATS
jgi:hypothetical protein